jgi:hypothetical protein
VLDAQRANGLELGAREDLADGVVAVCVCARARPKCELFGEESGEEGEGGLEKLTAS